MVLKFLIIGDVGGEQLVHRLIGAGFHPPGYSGVGCLVATDGLGIPEHEG